MSLADRVSGRLRRAWPDRVVRRDVQGVRLALPWSHRLPDYATKFPAYGQNLVEVARIVEASDGPGFVMVDIGANVGDSALQVLEAIDARVLCVEGDEYWLRYLHLNVDAEPRVRVVPALVLPDSSVEGLTAVRSRGTSHFVADGRGVDAATGVLPDTLRSENADLGRVRLVKSDTDGYDARIVPAMARAWSTDRPVLFFEYDHALTRKVGDDDPTAVWSALSALGYEDVVVWDNFGAVLGRTTVDDATDVARVLDGAVEARGYHYWDVAVVHRDDHAIRDALRALAGDQVLGAPA